MEVESPTAAQVSNLSVQISAALGLGASAVFTWRDGGSSQTLTCRILGSSATTCTDNTHSFNVAQGDEIDIRVVTTGTPGAITVVVASQFGTLSNLNPTFTISNAASTGTTVNTLTKLTGAPSTAVISAVTDTGGAVGITTAGAGTTGTATITTAGKFPVSSTGRRRRGIMSKSPHRRRGTATIAGRQPIPRLAKCSEESSARTDQAETLCARSFPERNSGIFSWWGRFRSTLTAPVSASFSPINFNTGVGVVTNQYNNISPVNSITLVQQDPGGTMEIAAISKAKVAATFTITAALSVMSNASGSYTGLFLYDGTAKSYIFGIETNNGLRASYFTTLAGSFGADIFGPTNIFMNPVGPLVWLRVQETASARLLFISPDGMNFIQIHTESNTANFHDPPVGMAVEMRASALGSATLYSFTETNP